MKKIKWAGKRKTNGRTFKTITRLKKGSRKFKCSTRKTITNRKSTSTFKRRNTEKQEELQKRFSELFTDEMKQMMEEIQLLMQQNIDKNAMNEMIEKMEFSTEELNKQLDQDLALFKQLEFEKKWTIPLIKLTI